MVYVFFIFGVELAMADVDANSTIVNDKRSSNDNTSSSDTQHFVEQYFCIGWQGSTKGVNSSFSDTLLDLLKSIVRGTIKTLNKIMKEYREEVS